MRGAGRLLGEQHLGHLGGRADREAVGGQAAELLLGPGGGVDRDTLEAPGEIGRVLLQQVGRRAADRGVLVGSADHLEQPADLGLRGPALLATRRGEDLHLRRELVHARHRHHEPAIGDAGGAGDAGGHLRAHQDGRARPLDGARANREVLEAPVPSAMRDLVLGPQPPDDLHALGEPAHPLRHRHPEDRELFRAVAEPHAQHEAPPGDHVEEGADLRDLHRVVQRQQHQVGPDGEARHLRGQPLQHRQQRKIVEPRRGVVLPTPDRVEPEGMDQPRLLQRLGKPPRRIIGGRMLRVEVDPELHGWAL